MNVQRPGLRFFADSHDVGALNATIAVLRRAGAVEVMPVIEGVNGHRSAMDMLLHLNDACRAIDVSVRPFTFPNLLGDLAMSRAWFNDVCEKLDVFGILDAEPCKIGHGVMHWTGPLLDPWRGIPRLAAITTTRAEAPHLGPHDYPVIAQFEQQNSLDTLAHGMEIFERTTPREKIVICTGAFNQPNDPRTVDEVKHDLLRSTPQAKLTGQQAVWSVHTTSPEKADAFRDWALTTF